MIDYDELFQRSMIAQAAGEQVHLTAAEHAELKGKRPETPPADLMEVCYGVPCVVDP